MLQTNITGFSVCNSQIIDIKISLKSAKINRNIIISPLTKTKMIKQVNIQTTRWNEIQENAQTAKGI